MISKINYAVALICALFSAVSLAAQSKHWQHQERAIHYTENEGDYLLVHGRHRFNRALYGTHDASRVEAGDLPEFALYMPGMGGNLQFVLETSGRFKKMIEADAIETRYRPGSMRYRIEDELLGDGCLELVVLAQADSEGLIVQVSGSKLPEDFTLYAVYGGASGKTFSRNGDIGADPESSFYLLPEYCQNNSFKIVDKSFELHYLDRKNKEQVMSGMFGQASHINLSDARVLNDPSRLENVSPIDAPIIYAIYRHFDNSIYIQIGKGPLDRSNVSKKDISEVYNRAEQARRALASRLTLRTPDRYINNLGGTLAVAADGIWESPTFLHGAVAWRMRLNAWRGAYAADALGWHDRAREHFTSYSNSQVLEPEQALVVMDTALHLARHIEEMGTSMFSSGYISRNPNNNTVAHHYDMNLVFFDQLFSHFDYTGDINYLRKMWPVLERHMDWQRRNFSRNGLYDAYCAIWASDGLQYSGGGVAHTSAYNYRANCAMAKLARLLGKDPLPYEEERIAIKDSMMRRLWLNDYGYFAEYQDALGEQLLHDRPGLWTIYHAADAHMLDRFESYQNVQYINNHLPHIPISVQGQEDEELYTLATTTWQPYTWSVNNVALAENLQASLAYWQAGRSDEAYHLWRSNLMESMYHGISPGNFQQLSHYDAFRGELYRDFADPIGVAARTLTEGLFGYLPKLLDGHVHIKPGFPSCWDFAELHTPEWDYHYKRTGDAMQYEIKTRYDREVSLHMELPVDHTQIRSVWVNGKEVSWRLKEQSINQPIIQFETGLSQSFSIRIELAGHEIKPLYSTTHISYTDKFSLHTPDHIQVMDIYDPQKLIGTRSESSLQMIPKYHKGTFFVQLECDDVSWWEAIDIELLDPVEVSFEYTSGTHTMVLNNRSNLSQTFEVRKSNFQQHVDLGKGERKKIIIPAQFLTKGTNSFALRFADFSTSADYVNWEISNGAAYQTTGLVEAYNAKISDIFQQEYLSPRPKGPTLQLPWQGIGNWCYPLIQPDIDDRGLMNMRQNGIVTYLDIPFLIASNDQNVVFVSKWDNYPDFVELPLDGNARKAYLIVVGTTNPMQSQMTNGRIEVLYTDGTTAVLELKNPSNWWPIEQDLFDDNYAFEIADNQIPYRIKLQSGESYRGGTLPRYSEIKGYTSRAIEGGAATLLDVPLDSEKELKAIKIRSITNDVVVGVIAVTLLQ